MDIGVALLWLSDWQSRSITHGHILFLLARSANLEPTEKSRYEVSKHMNYDTELASRTTERQTNTSLFNIWLIVMLLNSNVWMNDVYSLFWTPIVCWGNLLCAVWKYNSKPCLLYFFFKVYFKHITWKEKKKYTHKYVLDYSI